MQNLQIAKRQFESRLFTGTGKFSSLAQMRSAIIASGSQLVTLAFKRIDNTHPNQNIAEYLKIEGVHLLPNTSGARTASEAVLLAQMAREALETNWIKLEIHPDPRYLMPDPIETYLAAQQLVKEGFIVMPYINADPVLCKRLEDAGVSCVMPLGSPIGSNQGLKTRALLDIIIDQSNIPVIIDAGIGAPSHAALAMEMGADAVLVNTAIASSPNPEMMALAFKQGVEAGRHAFEAGLGTSNNQSIPTSPLTAFLD
jgi:thiazole synthase